MQKEATHLIFDQAGARRLLLVRAIDEVDTQGKLLGDSEREQLEREAVQACGAGDEPDPAKYLQLRARKILAAVDNRNPRLAAAQEPEAWRRWIVWLLPLAACLLGAALDRIDNPQRVNMLSPPLLGVLFWNLATYLLLAARLVLRRPRGAPASLLQRWLAGASADGRRTGRLRPDVLGRFHLHWLRATGRQQASWGSKLLHLTAAGWAAGLGLSIVLGGLVRQYRVGWESTLLDLDQVHAFLSFLFAPVVHLLPFDGFSAADLQRMAFNAGTAVGVDEARRWVWMYLALLVLVVVVPRLLLAAWATWRGRRLGQAVRIDLRDPYFTEVLARVRPARLVLGVLATDDAARARLWHQLAQAGDRPPPLEEVAWTVLATSKGDTLGVVGIPADALAPDAAMAAVDERPARRGWLRGLWARVRPRQRASLALPAPAPTVAPAKLAGPPLPRDLDAVLMLPAQAADVEAAAGLLRALDKPIVLLAPDAAKAACSDSVRALGLDARVLGLEQATAHWLRDADLLYALRGRVGLRQLAGFDRLAGAWKERNAQRFAQAMGVLARLLARAAREAEDVAGPPTGLLQLVKPADRDAAQQARERAAVAVFERLRAQEALALAELVRLHRVAPAIAPPPGTRHDDPFRLQRQLDVRQAGVAGAGSGAAMGAGIDLMVGGLTLGAAAALGAVIGGGAAYVAALWRNRSTASGRAQLQLSDDMLQSLAENALLAYLVVAHRGLAPGAELPPAWREAVASAVAARREALSALWPKARNAIDEDAMVAQLAPELETIARGLLARL